MRAEEMMSSEDIVFDGKFWIDSNGVKHRYVDPMSDEGFKAIFGMEGCEELLMELLNRIIPDANIVSVTYKNTEHVGMFQDDGKAIFDVYCEDSTGARFLVEVQNWSQRYFNKRAVYYSTYAIQDQATKERNYQLDVLGKEKWDYSYAPVYVVCFLNFDMHKKLKTETHTKEDECISFYNYLDIETGERLGDGTTLVFIEMKKFRKRLQDCVNDRERILCTMKNMSRQLEMPDNLSDTILQKIYNKAELYALPNEVRIRYISQIMKMNDFLNSQAEKIEEAHAAGLEEGITSTRLHIAQAMKNLGIEAKLISQATGLSLESIEALYQTSTRSRRG